MHTKNIAQSTSLFQKVEEGIFILHRENESDDF